VKLIPQIAAIVSNKRSVSPNAGCAVVSVIDEN
jgi:hypothetical protein